MSQSEAALERAVRDTNWRFRLLGFLAVLGLGVLAGLIFFQARTESARDRAISLQQHTFEVIMRANQLSGAISAAEAALGRYVVSSDKLLGRQYEAHWRRAADQLNRLRQITTDDKVQQERLDELKSAFETRGKELSDAALYTNHSRHRDAWGQYYSVRMSDAHTRVEALLSRVVENERALLNQRTSDATKLIASSSLAARILTIFGMLIVLAAVALGWMVIEAHGERAVADADADAERERAAELQAAVTEATAKLRAEVQERIATEERLRQAQKMEAVGQLTGGIAHDFNNMLAVVLGGLELSKRRTDANSPVQRHLDSAMEGANRAAALTRRLLAFSRAEPLLPEPLDPSELVDGMRELLDRTLGDGIEVKTETSVGDWLSWVDRHQLENALLNLAVNARDAMDGKGRLTLRALRKTLRAGEVSGCAAGDYVAIAVEDSGHGMTPEILERVFEPFFTTKPVGQGTGLGLSQIFGFIQQSEGAIGIDTTPGEGTAVTLYLPRFKGEVDAQPRQMTDIIIPHTARPLSILVVEDDPRVLASTTAALAEQGHAVRGCLDPSDVPSILDEMARIDAIVSDVLMPGQTGPELIASLGDRIAGVAVLFVTGYTGEVDANIFQGRPVLRKPFTMGALARALEDAVAETERSSDA